MPADPRFLWVRSPFFWSYVFITVLVYARDVRPGADGCAFPSAIVGVFWNRIQYLFAFDRLFRGVFAYRGGRTCFPGRD